MSFTFQASKAALTSYYESLRVELAREVTITIVTPGFIESEITEGKELSQKGLIEVNTRFKEVSKHIFNSINLIK